MGVAKGFFSVTHTLKCLSVGPCHIWSRPVVLGAALWGQSRGCCSRRLQPGRSSAEQQGVIWCVPPRCPAGFALHLPACGQVWILVTSLFFGRNKDLSVGGGEAGRNPLFYSCYFIVRTLNTGASLTKIRVHNTVVLTLGTMLYSGFLELIHLA